MRILYLASMHVFTHAILLNEIQLLLEIATVFSWYSYISIRQTDSSQNLSTATFI